MYAIFITYDLLYIFAFCKKSHVKKCND